MTISLLTCGYQNAFVLGGAPRAIGFTCGYGFFYVWPLNQDNIKNELGSAPNPSTKTHTAKGSTTPKESAVESRPPHFSAENFRVQPSNPSCPHLRLLNRVKGTSLRTECTHPVGLQSVMVGASQGLHLTIMMPDFGQR